MPDQIGPHLLGRLYRPDAKDWDLERLHTVLARAGLPDPDLSESLGHAIDVSPYFADWPGMRALWRYTKAHRHPKPAPVPAPILWADRVVLDQGDFGTCVGNGWAGWGDSEPIEDNYTEVDARAIYYEATVIDGSPDMPTEPPDLSGGQQGAAVRSGAKAMQNRGRLLSYAFAGSLDDIDHWLDEHGPVVMGTDWTRAMFAPAQDGLVMPIGPVDGGHCWLLRYRKPLTTRYRCRNSWGTRWGDGGDFEIERSDLRTLLAGIAYPGEACLAAEIV